MRIGDLCLLVTYDDTASPYARFMSNALLLEAKMCFDQLTMTAQRQLYEKADSYECDSPAPLRGKRRRLPSKSSDALCYWELQSVDASMAKPVLPGEYLGWLSRIITLHEASAQT